MKDPLINVYNEDLVRVDLLEGRIYDQFNPKDNVPINVSLG